MPSKPRLSVIIPALNEEKGITRAVRSAEACDEVLVVDGGSDDETCELAKMAGAQLLTSDRGRGQQLRAGAEQATGDILVFLHADSLLHRDAPDQLRRHAADFETSRTFGCFRQSIDDQAFRFRMLEWGNAFRARTMRMPYGDQGMFVDRKTYDEVGGFDAVPLMEDVMMSRKLSKLCRPTVLPGPIHLSARRWHANGVIRQTLRNWCIYAAFSCGTKPAKLATWYQ